MFVTYNQQSSIETNGKSSGKQIIDLLP